MHVIPNLYLNELAVRDLRCHTQLKWTCSTGVNLLYGDNGCGKTTLLEAIYMMVFGRSFRQAQLPEMVRYQASEFHIQGRWKRYGPLHVDMRGKRRQTITTMQGKVLRNKEGVRNSLDVILDAVQGKQIMLASPRERRKWLDQSILRCHSHMAIHYQTYYRCLLQRNRLQRQHGSSDELHSWHIQLVQHGQKIMQIRREFIQDMNAGLFNEVDFVENNIALQLHETAGEGDAWLTQLQQHQRSFGPLRFGPHCDKLNILYQGQEVRRTASSGQQKLASIAIRLVQQQLHGQYRGINPVLLLDDGMESLDQKRQEKLLERLVQNKTQIFLSVPLKKTWQGIMSYALSNGVLKCDECTPCLDEYQ